LRKRLPCEARAIDGDVRRGVLRALQQGGRQGR
jgi:hypothetical protein